MRNSCINTFIRRLKALDIEIELIGNYPWVYLSKVNGKQVKGIFQANHGWTAFYIAVKPGQKDTFSDIKEVF